MYSLGFAVENNLIDRIVNLSPPPFNKCTDYHELADEENGAQPQAVNIRGISAAGFRYAPHIYRIFLLVEVDV
jgi:hypothetical protein